MKKLLVIGATGLMGNAIVQLASENYEVYAASRTSELSVDISSKESLELLLETVGQVDAIICTGGIAYFKPYTEVTDDDWEFAISNKMMGQINIMRLGEKYVRDGGTIILTTGQASEYPFPGSSIVTTVNRAVEGAVKAFSVEIERIRVNAMSPGWVTDTLVQLGMDPSEGQTPEAIAEAYLDVVEQSVSGETIPSTL